MGNNFWSFIDNFYFWKLIPTTLRSRSGDCISYSQNSNEIRKRGKSGKDHDAFLLLIKRYLDYPKNVIFGHLKIKSLQNKFESISELIKGNFNIFLISKTNLDAPFPSNQFAVSGYIFVRKHRNKFGRGTTFYITDQLPSWTIKNEIEITIHKNKILAAEIYNPSNLNETDLLLVLKPLEVSC